MANIEQILWTDFVYPEWLEKINDNFIAINTQLWLVVIDLWNKQAVLVSWENIKTINGESLLWAWNIVISWWGWGWGWDANIKITLPNVSMWVELWKPVFFWTLWGWTEYLKPTWSQNEYAWILNAFVWLNDWEVQVSWSIDNITLYNSIQWLDINTSDKVKLYLLLQSAWGWEDKMATLELKYFTSLAYYLDDIYLMNWNSTQSPSSYTPWTTFWKTTCSKYSVSNNIWTSISSSPNSKASCHAIEYNWNIRTLYWPDRVGASSGIISRTTYEYNISLNSWSDLGGASFSRYMRWWFELWNNWYFYLFWWEASSTSPVSNVEYYNPLNNTYTSITSMLVSGATIWDKYNNNVWYLITWSNFYTYDTLTNTYTWLPSTPISFSNSSSYWQVKNVNWILYAQVSFSHYAYNTTTSNWTQLPNTSIDWRSSTMITYWNNRYYIIGWTSNQVFTPEELYENPVLTVNPIWFEVWTLYNAQKLVMKYI